MKCSDAVTAARKNVDTINGHLDKVIKEAPTKLEVSVEVSDTDWQKMQQMFDEHNKQMLAKMQKYLKEVNDMFANEREGALYVRNPESKAKLWRISASKLRAFTHREYARLQTFPDDWVFYGHNQREIQLQIGNAVPVAFAKKIAQSVREALEVLDGVRKPQPQLYLFPDFI